MSRFYSFLHNKSPIFKWVTFLLIWLVRRSVFSDHWVPLWGGEVVNVCVLQVQRSA